MLQAIDNYFLKQQEPYGSCLQAIRSMILSYDAGITEAWKYGMPFYCYDSRMLCYLWVHKKYRSPYIGIVDGNLINHPLLRSEKRTRMKILLVDPGKDIDTQLVYSLLAQMLVLRQ